MSIPSKEEYVAKKLGFAKHLAEAEWATKYGEPMRARQTARAWVGLIQLQVMGSSAEYARAGYRPYPPPETAVVPAAPDIRLTKMGFAISYLPAGAPFRFCRDYEGVVRALFDGLDLVPVPNEQYTLETQFPEDRVLLTWTDRSATPQKGDPHPRPSPTSFC